jgi:hypothetical protein
MTSLTLVQSWDLSVDWGMNSLRLCGATHPAFACGKGAKGPSASLLVNKPETGALSAAYPTQAQRQGLTPISCHAVLERSACTPFIKERRMKCINAIRRKSGQMGHLNLRSRYRRQGHCSLNLPQASRLLEMAKFKWLANPGVGYVDVGCGQPGFSSDWFRADAYVTTAVSFSSGRLRCALPGS